MLLSPPSPLQKDAAPSVLLHSAPLPVLLVENIDTENGGEVCSCTSMRNVRICQMKITNRKLCNGYTGVMLPYKPNLLASFIFSHCTSASFPSFLPAVFLQRKTLCGHAPFNSEAHWKKLFLYTAEDVGQLTDHFGFKVSAYMTVCVSEPISNQLFCLLYLKSIGRVWWTGLGPNIRRISPQTAGLSVMFLSNPSAMLLCLPIPQKCFCP